MAVGYYAGFVNGSSNAASPRSPVANVPDDLANSSLAGETANNGELSSPLVPVSNGNAPNETQSQPRATIANAKTPRREGDQSHQAVQHVEPGSGTVDTAQATQKTSHTPLSETGSLHRTLTAYASLSPASGLRPVTDAVSLELFAPVYIHFTTDSGDINLQLTLVNDSASEIVSVENTTVREFRSVNFHHLTPPLGWETGRYELKAHEVHRPNVLLASVHFEIESVYIESTGDSPTVNLSAINEMRSVGQAIDKSAVTNGSP